MPRSSKLSPSFTFSQQKNTSISPCFHAYHMPCPYLPLSSDHPYGVWWEAQTLKLPITQFYPLFYYFFSFEAYLQNVTLQKHSNPKWYHNHSCVHLSIPCWCWHFDVVICWWIVRQQQHGWCCSFAHPVRIVCLDSHGLDIIQKFPGSPVFIITCKTQGRLTSHSKDTTPQEFGVYSMHN